MIETSRSAGRKIIEGISRYVMENQNWLIHMSERHIFDSPSWLKSWQGDGIITRTADWGIHTILKKKKLPFVELHGDNEKIPLDVMVDETQVARLAADHFWGHGFQNFAFFGLGNAWWKTRRSQEFIKALKRYDAKCRVFPTRGQEEEIFPSVMADDKTLRKIVRWLKSLPKPLGLWAATDLDAFYVLEACQLAGIASPEEIAVLGTDNDELFCRILIPQLSSIDINAGEIGYQAALLLEKRMQGHNIETPIVTSPSHIEIRQSTDTIAIADMDVAKAIRYIRDHSSSQSMNVKDVADWIGLSTRSLQLKFKHHLHRTPAEEIMKTRLEHACRLLRDSDIKISQIGQIVGFSSSSHFFYVFQKMRGVTPLVYRTSLQNIKEDSQ